MLKNISPLVLLLAFNANAHCLNSTEVGIIQFDKNSSYFDSNAGNTLKQLQQAYQPQAGTPVGYLLIEFEFNRSQGDADLQKYNMWLAERRVERVKEFLTKGGFGSAMVSRIRTAVDSENRELKLSWCNTPDQADQQMLADATPSPREPIVKAL